MTVIAVDLRGAIGDTGNRGVLLGGVAEERGAPRRGGVDLSRA